MTLPLNDDPLDEAHSTLETAETSAGMTRPVPKSAPRTEVHVDDSQAIVCYANFCRVTGTPEELILDAGLNCQPMGAPSEVAIKQRLVLNYFTAKRLLQALAMSIERHEGVFGVLETDIAKRVAPSSRRTKAAG
ncbi:MAG: DUF3467 domain-containing protein [Pirellulales bacterium]